MRKFWLTAVIALALGGCAQLQKLETAVTTSVTPTQALVAANSFDAIESSATGYLIYCKANLATAACSADNRRNVLRYTRSGRAARNQIETMIQTSTTIPVAVYNTLITAVDNLKASPAATGGIH